MSHKPDMWLSSTAPLTALAVNLLRNGAKMLIDQFSAQRYTVFAAFVNLYLKTGNNFYQECAEVFCQAADSTART